MCFLDELFIDVGAENLLACGGVLCEQAAGLSLRRATFRGLWVAAPGVTWRPLLHINETDADLSQTWPIIGVPESKSPKHNISVYFRRPNARKRLCRYRSTLVND